MAQFTPRYFEEILLDMISYVQLMSDVTDFEIGAIERTILEAAALEDDEQYFQMSQLLDAFKLSTASGDKLDDRVAEFGILRLRPTSSTGLISITDGLLVKDTVKFNASAADVTITLDDSSDFPNTFALRLGEGTVGEEDIGVASNNTSTGVLTLSGALVYDHDAGERASIVTGSADVTISSGVRIQVPADGTTAAIVFVTVESGTLVNGNFQSTPIRARAEIPGTSGNVNVSTVTEFASNPPFSAASVINRTNFSGGRGLESDPELRERAFAAIQSLTKGTVLALKEGVIGVTDSVTGQQVTTSSILESFVDNEVSVYVDDGSGFIPDQVDLPREEMAAGSAIGASSLTITDASAFPGEGTILVSPEDPSQIEILEYSGVNYSTNVLTLVGTADNAHNIGDEVCLIDVITEGAETGQNFFNTSTVPLIANSYRLWLTAADGTSPVLQDEGIDYEFNRGTGEIELIGSGAPEGALLVANYDYYTGLLATVQSVIDGKLSDPAAFPGIRAAGIRVYAITPTVRRITVRASIQAIGGVQTSELIPLVQEVIENYINALGIGEDIIIAEIVERAMGVAGMKDFAITLPASNVVILEHELPRAIDSNGNTLVTIT